MNVMAFIDYDNFCQSLWSIDNQRQPHISRLQEYLMDYIKNTLNCKQYLPNFIRAYCYTGEYADTTITKIQKHLSEETDQTRKAGVQKVLTDAIRRQGVVNVSGQKDFFYKANYFDFFEMKAKPLQYSREKIQIFQKGVDVQLAVDLVSHAYNDNFDLAVVCSGDIDLLEALKLVKTLGKKIIVCSHPDNTAKDIRKESDHFINMAKLQTKDLDIFSFVAGKKQQNVLPTP